MGGIEHLRTVGRLPAGPWRAKDARRIAALQRRMKRMADLLRDTHDLLTTLQFLDHGRRAFVVKRIEKILDKEQPNHGTTRPADRDGLQDH